MERATSPVLECRSLLVLGGARSGKSRYARALAEAAKPNRLLIATASAGDDEMAARIALHRAERSQTWTTIEEQQDLVEALSREAREERATVVDCLTLWLANLASAGRDVALESRRLCQALPTLGGPVILVSNEVGLGIVPQTPLGRDFRDWQGRINQELAAVCDVVVFIAAGIPVVLKPAASATIALR